jgi:[ribosomal protein S18]-alanine N-acetyltransferase
VTVTTELRLEPLRWWHIDELLPMEADLFGVEQWSAAMFWNELANGNFYLVAVAGCASGKGGAELVGYAGLSVGDREAWVQNLAVRRDRQRHGIGRRLLDALIAEAAARGCPTVLLEVAVDNGPAQRLYAEYGFETVGVRRGYYQPTNTDALVMRRDG